MTQVKLYNLARMSTATTGTGTITLGSAISGFLSFGGAGVVDGDVIAYAIEDGTNSEIGYGTYTAAGTTLSRNVRKSTNSDAAISLSGSAQVIITPSASDIISNTGQMFDPPGRLTLSTGVPVLVSTVSGAATLYYTPFRGNIIWLYDGSSQWEQFEISELSIALSGGTASRLHDVFVYSNTGVPTLELTAWTNDTTRATALVLQDGRYVKAGATTRLYLGTIYIDGSNQCNFIVGGVSAGGTAAVVGLWNMYHRHRWSTFSGDSTDSWSYTTGAWRAANNSSTLRTSFVVGVAGDSVDARYLYVSSYTGSTGRNAIGYDSTSVPYDAMGIATAGPTGAMSSFVGSGVVASAGYHYVTALEYGATTVTWYGDVGLSTVQSGVYCAGSF